MEEVEGMRIWPCKPGQQDSTPANSVIMHVLAQRLMLKTSIDEKKISFPAGPDVLAAQMGQYPIAGSSTSLCEGKKSKFKENSTVCLYPDSYVICMYLNKAQLLIELNTFSYTILFSHCIHFNFFLHFN